MPAPTALQRAPAALANEESLQDGPQTTGDDDIMITTTDLPTDTNTDQPEEPLNNPTELEAGPSTLFAPETPSKSAHRTEDRKIRIPPHRMTPLKTAWPRIYPPWSNTSTSKSA